MRANTRVRYSRSANPRKPPKQERSRALVESILAAAARVLVADGYEGATTNRIADTAGISVGSLYQYFPNKEAIVATLFERHAEKMWEVFATRAAAHWDAPLDEAVAAVIDALWEAHGVEPRLHRVLHEQVPRIGRLGRQREINRRARELAARFLAARGLGDETRAFVVVEIVEALIHASVEEPGIDRARVREEAIAAVLHYLRATPRRR